MTAGVQAVWDFFGGRFWGLGSVAWLYEHPVPGPRPGEAMMAPIPNLVRLTRGSLNRIAFTFHFFVDIFQ